MIEFVFGRPVKNIVEKGENACYQSFVLCPQCFQKFSSVSLTLYLIMPILGSFISTANKDTMSKIWTNGDTVI